MRKAAAGAAIALLAFVIGCGGSDNKGVTNPNPNSAGTMTARIDGAAWTAATVRVTNSGVGGLIITGANASTTGIGLGVSKNQGTGTQTFGTNANALGTLTIGVQSWSATGQPGGGSSGSVTLTTLTATRAVGTFTFTATPFTGGGTGNHVVTQGTFDVTF